MGFMKCDRCGMEIIQNSSPVYKIHNKLADESLVGIYKQDSGSDSGYSELHLCDPCREDFQRFWSAEEE